MKSALVLALAAAALANPMPQGVHSAISPDSSAPSGCSDSRSGEFQITVVNVTSSSEKRDVEKRQKSGILTLKLQGGILKDQADRTGYIASNYQFQFDSPPQNGAIYTSGFSVCSNGSLALGGSAIFYQCYSGGFFNLYDRHWAQQCSRVYIMAMGGSSGGATQLPDGQPQESPINEATDGQIMQPTGMPAPPVSQLTDGQPQAPTGGAPPVSQLPDGQPQAPTGGLAVSQLPDGQPQAPTGGAPEVPEGQTTCAPTPITSAPVEPEPTIAPPPVTGPPVTQIPDGQPQVPAGTGAPVPIPVPVPNGTYTAPVPPAFTGAAAGSVVYGFGAVAAGMLGLVAAL